MLAASLLLVGMDGVVKWLADDRGYHVTQIAFLRYFVCLFMAFGMARMAPQGLGGLRTRRLPGHLWRSVCNLITMLTFYVSLQLIPLPNSVSIGLAAPIFMTILSIPMLGERVGTGRWIAVGAGFIGILLIMRPEGGIIEWGALSALVSAVFWAFTLVSSRQLSSSEATHTILFYYALTVVVVLGIAMFWFWRTPTVEDGLLFLVVGIAGTMGQFCLNQAFRYGEVSMLAPLDYSGLIWAMILGALVWGDFPTPYMLAGSAIVITCCLYILRSGRKERAA
jgi:drug/metabolite transporter (DMT)-like permease